MNRGRALNALSAAGGHPVTAWLYYWIRFGIPSAILAVGIWWLLTSVIGSVPGV